jgi:hypothetical protein
MLDAPKEKKKPNEHKRKKKERNEMKPNQMLPMCQFV